MPPHWRPLWPWLPAGVPLTFNFWPAAPQNSSEPSVQCTQRGAHPVKHCHGDRETRQWVQVLTVSTGVTDVLYCCPLPWYSQHIVSKRSQKSSPICPDAPGLKRGSCCFLDGKLPATERSGYKSTALSSLLKKHVPTLGRWNFLLFCLLLVSSLYKWGYYTDMIGSHLLRFIHSFMVRNNKPMRICKE